MTYWKPSNHSHFVAQVGVSLVSCEAGPRSSVFSCARPMRVAQSAKSLRVHQPRSLAQRLNLPRSFRPRSLLSRCRPGGGQRTRSLPKRKRELMRNAELRQDIVRIFRSQPRLPCHVESATVHVWIVRSRLCETGEADETCQRPGFSAKNGKAPSDC